MSRVANYAPSTLSDAVQGKRMPTRAVVEAFARACAAEPDVWGERWAQAAVESGEAADTADTASAPNVVTSRRRTVLLVAALVAVSAASSTLTWLAIPSAVGVPATKAASTFAVPSDGQDPASVGCGSDTTVLGETPVSVLSVGAGMLQLKYSPKCQAGWARFYLNPNSTPVLVEVRVQASDGRASAFAYLAEGNTPVYTDLLHPARGCLTASVIVHAQNQDPATFTTPCMQAG